MKISQKGINLIKAWEGIEDGDPTTVNLDPYLDAGGRPTIGWGHLVKPGEDFTGGITVEQAEKLLQQDVTFAEKAVEKYIKVKINQNQFDALCSWTYNLGWKNLFESTMLKWINGGRDVADIPIQMVRWNKDSGRPLLGLARRRVSEAALFLS